MHPKRDQHIQGGDVRAQAGGVALCQESDLILAAESPQPVVQGGGVGLVFRAAVGEDTDLIPFGDEVAGDLDIPAVEMRHVRHVRGVIADRNVADDPEAGRRARPLLAGRLRIKVRGQEAGIADHLGDMSRLGRHQLVPQRLGVGVAHEHRPQNGPGEGPATHAQAGAAPVRGHPAGIDRNRQMPALRLLDGKGQLGREIEVQIRDQIAAADHDAVGLVEPGCEMRAPSAHGVDLERCTHDHPPEWPGYRVEHLHDRVAAPHDVPKSLPGREVDRCRLRVRPQINQFIFKAFR